MLRAIRPITLLSAALFAVATIPQGASAQAQHKWKMASAWGGGPLQELGAKGFAERVEFLTEGRIQIQVFPAGTLGKAFKVTETVSNGVAQVGHHWPGYDWGKDKTAVVFGSFAGSMDSERMLHWIYEGGGKELWRQWRDEEFDVVGLPCGIRT